MCYILGFGPNLVQGAPSAPVTQQRIHPFPLKLCEEEVSVHLVPGVRTDEFQETSRSFCELPGITRNTLFYPVTEKRLSAETVGKMTTSNDLTIPSFLIIMSIIKVAYGFFSS